MSRGSRLQRLLTRGRRSRREAGYVAIVTAIVFAGFGFGCAAVAVDTARWWVEVQRVQKAADVASLAGVTYLPQDLASAQTTAIDVSTRNGYPNSGSSSVVATTGAKPSQLKVTVCSTVPNNFGALIGTSAATVCRTAVADYTGPAPMGSPCNTFGNEPTSGGGSSSVSPTGTAQGSSPYANCSKRPQFWATIEGPATDKVQGDRFQTKNCATGTAVDGCTSGNVNSEYRQEGYFYLVRVQPAAVGQTIDLQLYDAGYSKTATTNSNGVPQPCGLLPQSTNWTSDTPNPYVNDASKRYASVDQYSSSTQGAYCTGDSMPGTNSTSYLTTSFALRQQTDTLDPMSAPVQNDTSGAACIKQFRGLGAPGVNTLTSTSSSYDEQRAQSFHNWFSLCKFTPTRAGDYYLQVRSNVSFGGYRYSTPTNGNADQISVGNTAVLADDGNTSTGQGNNAFAIRAVTPSGSEQSVSVSGYDRMPIYANADSASQTFNLIRVIPAGAGKSIAFSFFDAGDASGNATVTVIAPADAKTTGNNTLMSSQSTAVQFPGGCKATGGNAGTGATYSNCAAPITNTANNGKIERLNIPIPNDYTCTYTSLGGCWYQVKVAFANGSNVTDVTTWTATVTGDPVRLIE